MFFLKKIKHLFKKNNKTIGTVFFKNSTTKHAMTASCTLTFSTETEKKKKEINEDLKKIIKKYINAPEKLIKYMQLQGMSVYRYNHADKLLSKIGEEEGFLTPLKGLKAFIINLALGILCESGLKIGFSTKEMFVFNAKTTEIYTIARALHKYYGYREKLPGYDYKSQEIFKKVYNQHKRKLPPFASCSINDMYACKEAIARDLESINFSIELSKEYDNAKEALKKIKETNSVKI